MKRFSPKALILLPVMLLLCGAGFWTWRKYRQPSDDDPPIPTDVTSPMGTDGKRNWSKAVVHFPGYPVHENDREWSHWEIAQRHKALVMKDLPEYITELRGGGALHETPGTSAAWFFVVPEARLPDFKRYIQDLGVPSEALHESKAPDQLGPYYVWDPEHTPTEPAKSLIFGWNEKAVGDTEVMGMKFGKSGDEIVYFLANPNLSRAIAQIVVDWDRGHVQIAEKPLKPDSDK